MSGVWGTLACGLFAVPLLAKNLAHGHGRPRLHGRFHQLGVQALGLAAVGVLDVLGVSFGVLWVMKKLWGIRVTRRPRRRASTSPSTACGATPSSTSRSRAATGPRRTATSAVARPASAAAASRRGTRRRRRSRASSGEAPGRSGRGRSRRDPPATAGSRMSVAPSATAVSSPSKRRTSEPSMKTFRNCGSSSPSKMRLRSDGYVATRLSSASRTVAAAHVDLAVAAGLRAQDRRDADRRHGLERYTAPIGAAIRRRSSSRSIRASAGKSPPDGGEPDRHRAAGDDRRHGAEQRRRDAGLEGAELVRGADEHHLDREHAPAQLVGRRERDGRRRGCSC